MILVVSCSYDLTVSYIIKKYSERSKFFRLNVDEIEKYKISISNNKFEITNKETNKTLKSDEIKSIYYRKIDFPNLDEYTKESHNYIKKDILSTIEGIVNAFPGKVLTKPCILRKCENKIFQLLTVGNMGICQPQSWITNFSDEINKIKEKLILKHLTRSKIKDKGNIYTSILDRKVDNIDKTPTYFQKYVNKVKEIRITVINSKFFGVEILSENKIDWRITNEKNRYLIFDVPDSLKKICLDILSEFNLKFGAFDFIYDGENYYFLEVNPNGQWLWLEEELKLEISKEIINYLDFY